MSPAPRAASTRVRSRPPHAGLVRLVVGDRVAALGDLPLRLERARGEGREHQRGLRFLRREVARLRVRQAEQPHHAAARAHRHQQGRADALLLEQAGPAGPPGLEIADRHRTVGGEAVHEQLVVRAEPLGPDAGEQSRAREHADPPGAGAGQREGAAHARQPAGRVAGAGQDLARLPRGEVRVHEPAQLPQVREVIAPALEQPLVDERGADAVGDDEEQEHVGRGEGRAQILAAREEHAADLALGPHRHRDALPHRESLDERIATGRLGGRIVGQHALLGEDAPDQPLARIEHDGLQVVAPEAAARAGHEPSGRVVQHEQQRPVRGQQPGDAIHRQPEQLAGRQPERRDRQDLLEDVEGVRVPVGMELRARPVAQALPEMLEDVAQLRERGADGVAGHLGAPRAWRGGHFPASVRMYRTSAQRSLSGRCRHEGMAPRPVVIFQKISPSGSSWTRFEVQSAGFGFSATAAGPLPLPWDPWQDTQLTLATFSPCSTDFLSAGIGFFFVFSDAGATHGRGLGGHIRGAAAPGEDEQGHRQGESTGTGSERERRHRGASCGNGNLKRIVPSSLTKRTVI